MLTVWAALGESSSLQSVLSCSPKWSWRERGGKGGCDIRLGGEWGWWKWHCGVETGSELHSSSKLQNVTVSWGGAVTQMEHREF